MPSTTPLTVAVLTENLSEAKAELEAVQFNINAEPEKAEQVKELTATSKTLAKTIKSLESKIVTAQKRETAQAEKAEKAEAAAKLKAEKAAEKEAKAAEKIAAKEAAAAAKAAKLAEKEASQMPIQNEIRRPKPNSVCGRVWELADTLSMANQSAVSIKELIDAGNAEPTPLNLSTIKTQYARWRKFNGVSGRIVSPVETAPTTEV